MLTFWVLVTVLEIITWTKSGISAWCSVQCTEFLELHVTSNTKWPEIESVMSHFSMRGSGFVLSSHFWSTGREKISLWGALPPSYSCHPNCEMHFELRPRLSHSRRGNFTVPKLSESNMGYGMLSVFLGLLLEVSTHGPHAVPRTSWRHQGEPSWNTHNPIAFLWMYISNNF